jgi:hypothetical protein
MTIERKVDILLVFLFLGICYAVYQCGYIRGVNAGMDYVVSTLPQQESK